MSLIPIVFWTLVLVTALVALRWGAMIGLIGFILALMIGAVAVSRLAPPTASVSAGVLHLEAGATERPPISVRTPIFSMC